MERRHLPTPTTAEDRDTTPVSFPTRGVPGGWKDWWDSDPVAAVHAEQQRVRDAVLACRETPLRHHGTSADRARHPDASHAVEGRFHSP